MNLRCIINNTGNIIEFRPREVQYFLLLFNHKTDPNVFTPAEWKQKWTKSLDSPFIIRLRSSFTTTTLSTPSEISATENRPMIDKLMLLQKPIAPHCTLVENVCKAKAGEQRKWTIKDFGMEFIYRRFLEQSYQLLDRTYIERVQSVLKERFHSFCSPFSSDTDFVQLKCKFQAISWNSTARRFRRTPSKSTVIFTDKLNEN